MWTTDWLYTIVNTSVIASVMALVILLVRTVFRRSLPKKALFMLWMLVLVKLIIPFQLPSPVSIYNAVNLEEMAISTPVKTLEPSMPEGNIPTDPGVLIPSEPDTPVDSNTTYAPITPIEPIKPSEPAISNSPSLLVTDMLGWVHIGVFCAALTGITVVYILNHYRLFKAKTVTPPMQEVVRQSGFADNTRFCSLSGHRSVMLFGIFRPTVILPEGYTPDSEQEFGYILAHEREHFRNKDNLWQVLMLAALCLHWFNPIVWLVYHLFLADIEAACDERVLDHLSETDKQDYAHVVLNVAGRYHHSKPLMAMGFAKVRLKDRIKWIVNHKKVGISAGILSVVLFLTIAVMLGTGAMNNEDTEPVDKTDASTPTSPTTTYPTAVQPIWGSDISATPKPIVFSDALVTGEVLTVETNTIDLRGAGNGDYSSHIAVVQTFDELKTLYNSDVEHDAIQKDKQYINNYNADFFKDHSLIVLCMNKSSISLKHTIDRVYLCGQHLYIDMSSLDEKNTVQLMAGARFRTFITVKKAEFKDATNIVVYNKSVKTLPTEENTTTTATTTLESNTTTTATTTFESITTTTFQTLPTTITVTQEEQIKADFVAYCKKQHPYDPMYQSMTVKDVVIDQIVGTYEDVTALFIRHKNETFSPFVTQEETTGGGYVTYPSGHKMIYYYNNTFQPVSASYEDSQIGYAIRNKLIEQYKALTVNAKDDLFSQYDITWDIDAWINHDLIVVDENMTEEEIQDLIDRMHGPSMCIRLSSLSKLPDIRIEKATVTILDREVPTGNTFKVPIQAGEVQKFYYYEQRFSADSNALLFEDYDKLLVEFTVNINNKKETYRAEIEAAWVW